MKSQKRGTRRKRWIFGAVAIIILAVGGCLAYRHYHHKKIVAVTASQNTKGEGTATTPSTSTTSHASSSSSAPSSNTSSSQPGDNKANTGGTATTPAATLTAPTGVFVNNHHPNLSGSPAPNQMTSNCSTVSGATCQIIFTKDGVTKSLAAQMTDRGGSTYWNWKLQDIGLTAGEWHIQAKATLGSQVTTSDDALDLDVQP